MTPSHPTITATVNTLNEECNIRECLATLAWADEIVVVDMHSDDATARIAREMGAKVYLHERTGYVEPARNFAIQQATSEWVLIVDADERVPGELAQEIRRVIGSPKADIYNIAEKNVVFGSWMRHGMLWPDYHPRLFKKESVTWPSSVHDRPIVNKPMGFIEAREQLALHHYSRSYLTLDGFLTGYLVKYSRLEADALHLRGHRFRRRHLLLIPWREFKEGYIVRKGYKDGFPGLVMAVLFSCYRAISVIQYWDKFHPEIPDDRDRSLISYIVKLMLDK